MFIRQTPTMSLLSLSLFAIMHSQIVLAETPTDDEPLVILDAIQVTVNRKNINGLPLGRLGLSDNIIQKDSLIHKDSLKQRGANIGDALSGELGIHANQFGGGASAPVIRGQEGKRIKILNSGGETLDMSSMSPDHAVTVDSLLASQVEVLRGASTLLYSSGNSAGVVNVVDNKIPNTMPDGTTGDVAVRLNSADKERLTSFAINTGVGQNIAISAQGLYKKSDDYRTPSYTHQGQTLRTLPDSFASSQSGSLGVSWIGDTAYLGVAYSERQDKYGLPAHSHLYEDCHAHIVSDVVKTAKPYLNHYPFLLEESDVDYVNPGLERKKIGYHSHSLSCQDDHHHGTASNTNTNHSHDTHSHDNPHIALRTKRVDVRGAWQNPIAGIQSIRLNAGHAKYRHDEKTGSVVDNAFKNTGYQARLEVLHAPIGRLTGVAGVQYVHQDSQARDEHTVNYRRQHLLHDHTSTQSSVFAVERLTFDKVRLDFGARLESQKIAMKYNIAGLRPNQEPPTALTQPRKDKAFSYGMSAHWQASDEHKLGLSVSRQERLPNAQELYAHGKHLVTNSFDTGNKNLNKEKSTNFELNWAYTGDKADAKIATYYNDFDNYVYLATLNSGNCEWRANGKCSRSFTDEYPLRLNRYNQAAAKIYGVEAQFGYQFNDRYRVAVFGDYVRGKLSNLPALPTQVALVFDDNDNIIGTTPTKFKTQPDGNIPRIPQARLGLKTQAHLGEHWQAHAELYRTFDQNKVAHLENPTKGHTMLNAGLSYDGTLSGRQYTAFANAHNLLNSKVYNHASFLSYIPQSGRSVSVGLNVKF